MFIIEIVLKVLLRSNKCQLIVNWTVHTSFAPLLQCSDCTEIHMIVLSTLTLFIMSGCDGGLNLSVMAGLMVAWVSTFTIEIAVMLSKMSHGVLGVLRTDLALSKVCLLELGHNQTVCDNIKAYPDIQVNEI